MRSTVGVRVKDDLAHLTGVLLCGSVWACPECSARIRAARAEEIGRAVEQHMVSGGTAWMVTLTARHRAGMPLAPMLDRLTKGFRHLLGGRAAAAERVDLGIAGVVKAVEITYGASGWHPHLHVILLLDRAPDTAALARAMDRWSRTWRSSLAVRGMEPSKARGTV